MASVGHVLVGLAIAAAHERAVVAPRTTRERVAAAAAFATLALVPDLDVIAFRFGVPYADPFGHRGASHSLFAAVVVGALLAVPLARATQARTGATALAAIAALASHGVLDMLTDGGLGAALLWPLDDGRLFFPWRPLPVAPIGLGFLSPRGLWCVVVETAVLAPPLLLLLLAARRRRP